jgi:hypothetical protein
MKYLRETFAKLYSGPRIIVLLLIGVAMTVDHLMASTLGAYSLAMAALAEDRSTEERPGQYRTYGVKAATKIYAGSMVCVDADGYAVPAADTAGLIFVGRAEEQIDNTDGSSGDLSITVKRGTFNWDATGLTAANVGDAVFVLDDQTVGIASGSTNKVFAGVISEVVSSTSAWVEQDFTLQQVSAAIAIADAAALTVVDTNLAVVTGVDGAGSNAASKADVDTRLATQETFNDRVIVDLGVLRTKLNALLTALRNAGIIKT